MHSGSVVLLQCGCAQLQRVVSPSSRLTRDQHILHFHPVELFEDHEAPDAYGSLLAGVTAGFSAMLHGAFQLAGTSGTVDLIARNKYKCSQQWPRRARH